MEILVVCLFSTHIHTHTKTENLINHRKKCEDEAKTVIFLLIKSTFDKIKWWWWSKMKINFSLQHSLTHKSCFNASRKTCIYRLHSLVTWHLTACFFFLENTWDFLAQPFFLLLSLLKRVRRERVWKKKNVITSCKTWILFFCFNS